MPNPFFEILVKIFQIAQNARFRNTQNSLNQLIICHLQEVKVRAYSIFSEDCDVCPAISTLVTA